MPSYQRIALKGWKRESLYRMYESYADPLFSISGLVQLEGLIAKAKQHGLPFSQCLYFKSLVVCNEIEEFRLRIGSDSASGSDLRLYESVIGGTTIPKEDGTFDFIRFHYKRGMGLADFCSQFNVGEVHKSEPQHDPLPIIRHTIIPWHAFTAVKHPRSGTNEDAIPKIAFGKFKKNEAGQTVAPVSVEAHHGLMDGRHVCEYFSRMSQICG
ncbi:MAG: hypothetical protein LAT67_08040 [Balneolales bacterium]|nr:hypothetical protein [Balneolales bacterium]